MNEDDFELLSESIRQAGEIRSGVREPSRTFVIEDPDPKVLRVVDRAAMMNYKGYGCTIRFDDEAAIFHGEVSGLRDVVTFQGKTVDELKTTFRDSLDDYLDFCAARGEAANTAVDRA